MPDITQFEPSSLGYHQNTIAVTPTPAPEYAVVPIEIPTGWVMAGFLVLLLIIMLYQNFKRFIIGLFRKKKTG